MAHPPVYDPYYIPPPVPDAYLYNATTGISSRDRQPGIRTLFVSGLPDDVKAREIHNLFRRRHGFESCQLKYTGRGNQVVAFATFDNHQSAVAALLAVKGVKFDPHSGSTLHVELARANSRRKKRPGSGPYVVIDNRHKKFPEAQDASSDDGGGSDDSPEHKNPESGEGDGLEKSAADATDTAETEEKEQSEKASDGLQACSTLFIANLGPKCTEDELKEALSKYPGFNSTKLRARGGMPVAFADFEEVEQATEAMNALQGIELFSSDRGGMSIEYARSKMRAP